MKKIFLVVAACVALAGGSTTGRAGDLERRYTDYVLRHAYLDEGGKVQILEYSSHVPGWWGSAFHTVKMTDAFRALQSGIPYLDMLGRCWFNSPCRV